ncbi:hypothetical protein G6F58_013001 [Rhizopus delemar]|nr:hypothetical protein G6F58_013001 [Rhizopus delemar]
MQVVLAVLAQLLLRRVLQHRAQRVQHLLHRQLRRRPRVVVADRNVGGPARLDGQTDTDQARTHRVQRIGLGIEAELVGADELIATAQGHVALVLRHCGGAQQLVALDVVRLLLAGGRGSGLVLAGDRGGGVSERGNHVEAGESVGGLGARGSV